MPYANEIRRLKNTWEITIGGGEKVDINLKKTASILFYGLSPEFALPIAFLEDCRKLGISVVLHRTHIAEPMIFWTGKTNDRDDLLSKQILTRENMKARTYVARTLISKQWESRQWLSPTYCGPNAKLAACRDVEQVMRVEAAASKEYWELFFRKLDTDVLGRRMPDSISAALDAGSHFLAGVMLRWILTHGLSPSHAYLHRSTSYPSLVYDLLEPVRWVIEKSVFDAYKAVGDDENQLTARSIGNIKQMLDEPINVEPTRQIVYRRMLIHGQVIALRQYLVRPIGKYVPPVEAPKKTAGRKKNIGYTLPGEIWNAK